MKGEEGRAEGMGLVCFDEPCLDFFKSGEGGVEGVWRSILPLLTPLFQFPKLENFRGEEGFILSILLL